MLLKLLHMSNIVCNFALRKGKGKTLEYGLQAVHI